MDYSLIKLIDLSDEILLIIFKKLNNFEVLYSLIGVNDRLNKIALDSIFTSDLTLMRYVSIDSICPLSNPILDRLCLQVLPQIHHKIKRLDLESTSIKRILLAMNYPNLYGIGLYNINIKRAQSIFTEKCLTHIDKNQISSVIIDIIESKKKAPSINANTLVFTNIINMFKNLECLNFGPSSISYQNISFNYSTPSVISQNLLELHINVGNFTDCLYLFDGRFNKLHTVDVNISSIDSSSIKLDNKEKLPNLRCFSLHCDTNIDCFDELILTLLHRMSNLEKLDLSLDLSMNETLIDGNYLKINIINHMQRLNKFKFNIYSTFKFHNQTYFLSNEDIQNTFNHFKNNEIICCIDYFRNKQCGRYHIYTYPYQLKYYKYITNNFPGGLFKCVRQISLIDNHPFEHEFFLQISQSFPFLENINLRNYKPQNNKLCRESDKNNQDLSVIKYPHLTILILNLVHDDYIEQFLIDTITCLPNTVSLMTDYQQLKRVTHDFTRNATRINCSKLKSLCTDHHRIPEYVKNYFPHTEIF